LIVYALVLSDLSCAVDLFLDRRAAETALEAMLRDEPDWESIASVAELDFSSREQLAGLLASSDRLH
jgi:hypothetical protein